MIGDNVIRFDEVTSTNDIAKEYAHKKVQNGTVIIAKSQSKGRGRLGSFWESPERENIYMSIVCYTKEKAESLMLFPLIVSYAVAAAIELVTDIKTLIKWPNDLVINKKKICGILVETIHCADGDTGVIIGIGINVNQISFPISICDNASSIAIETGTTWEVETIIKAVINKVESYILTLPKDFLSLYKEKCITISTNESDQYNIIIESVDENKKEDRHNARAYGIDEKGRLLVIFENGEKKAITSGQVHVRGIYGYV